MSSVEVSIRQMLEAGAHFGHQTKRWNPKMKQYIFGARNGIYIIDLGKTARLFKDAVNFVSRLAAHGDQVLFVGTKRQAQEVIQEEARRSKQPFVTHRWLGGMLTNFRTIKGSIDRLNEVERLLGPAFADRLPKKELAALERERQKLERNLGGIRYMTKLPGAMFVIDPKEEHIAVAEANRLKIPVVALVDTNCDPDVVSYVIPANDDAMRSIKLFAAAIADACTVGQDVARTGYAQSTFEGGESFDSGVAGAAATEDVVVVRKPRHNEAEAGEPVEG